MYQKMCCWIIAIAGSLGIVSSARAATPAQVDQAIKKGQEFLLKSQKEGNWETVQKPANNVSHDVEGKQWGGITALTTYSLLASGIQPQDPRLVPAINFLKSADMVGIYAVGMRAQIWQYLPSTAEVRLLAKRDRDILLEAVRTRGPEKGLYDYWKTTGSRIDHSVSQYGVLGIWACERAGVEVPLSYWRMVEEVWEETQTEDGGWVYALKAAKVDDPKQAGNYTPKPSMGAAGVATLFITQDYLHSDAGLACTGNIFNPKIERGLEYMSKNAATVFKGKDLYTYYGMERIGVASGRKYFDTIDWFAHGADSLVKFQGEDGSWTYRNKSIGTAFSLLFLSRGRAPVVMNKLIYEVADPKDAKAADKPATTSDSTDKSDSKRIEGNWNQRPRDVANITRWIGGMNERPLNWQVVNLKVNVDELHDAPILYISGNQPLSFTPEEEAKLKSYVEQGGIILGHADCGKKEFADSFRKLGSKWFPSYEFRELPADHPVYTNQQFRRDKWKTKPSMLGLSNGVRELMLLIPSADLARSWQLMEDKGKEESFQVAADVFLYAVDKSNLRFKGESYLIHPDPKIKTDRTIELARLKYMGNWDPEPGAFRRLAAELQNSARLQLTVKTVELGKGQLGSNFKIAHLTGTTSLKIDMIQREELKKFVADGGTLIIDAAGGSSDFVESMDVQIPTLWPGATEAFRQPLPKEHAVFNLANHKIDAFDYRLFYKKNRPSTRNSLLRAIELNGRTAVYYSREDLTVGLVGQPVDGIIGYAPDTATDIMRNIVLSCAPPSSATTARPTPENKTPATKPAKKSGK